MMVEIRHRPGLDVAVGIFNQTVIVGCNPHGFSRQRGANNLNVRLDFGILETFGFELLNQ